MATTSEDIIDSLLAVHESVEEMPAHPLAKSELDAGEEVAQARQAEEQEAKEALSDLYDMGLLDPRFDGRLAQLRDAVTAHAEAEEELEFSRLREVVEPAKLERTARATKVAAAMSPTRPHPGTVLATGQAIVVEDTDDSLRAGPRGPSLLEGFHHREKIMRFDHERIPERAVHARGSGAHGYFQPYDDAPAQHTPRGELPSELPRRRLPGHRRAGRGGNLPTGRFEAQRFEAQRFDWSALRCLVVIPAGMSCIWRLLMCC